jgi:hypothetical protein
MRANVRLKVLLVLLAVVAGLGSVGLINRVAAHPGPHEISIADASDAEGDGGGTANVAMTISLDTAPVSGETVSVSWATSSLGGTATVVDDYTTTSGTVTFTGGETAEQILIPVVRDDFGELNETFRVNLFDASTTCTGVCATLGSSATITDGQGIFTISDDDAPGLAIDDITRLEDADAPSATTAFTFTVTRTGPTTQAVAVNYATANNSAATPSDYAAASGTITFPASMDATETDTITVLVNDDALDEPDENFRVNLSGATNGTITDSQGTGTILDDDPVPNPTVSVSDETVVESGTLVFEVTFSDGPGLTESASFDYATVDGTATAAGDDYTATSGTIVVGPGEAEQPIQIPVVTEQDAIDEPDETLTLQITKPTTCCTNYDYDILDGSGLGTITDDDAPTGTLSINDVTVTEGDAGTTAAIFTVTKANTAQPVTVDFATANGTATAGSDYTANSGTLTFTGAETTKTITVNVTGDTVDEPNEGYVVNLTNPTNATLTDSQGAGTITDDDAVTLAIGNATVVEGDAGTTPAVFTVTKTGSTGQTVTVQFATANGTATAPSDYTATSGTLTFLPADTTKTVSVPVVGDTAEEADESFVVNLSAPTNATLSDAQGAGTITDDDDEAPEPVSDEHDFNGDGDADAVFAAPGEAIGTLRSAGSINVVYGSSSGLGTSDAPQLWHLDVAGIEGSAGASDRYGAALAYGNFDGDEFDDLAVGIPGESSFAGAVSIMYGSDDGLTADDSQFFTQDDLEDESADAGDLFGTGLASGDFDEDGIDDLAIGAPGEDVEGAASGAVNVVYGSDEGLASDDTQVWSQEEGEIEGDAEAGDRFGAAVATGDLNGDGSDDLVVGARLDDEATTDAGSVHAIYGGPDGLTDEGNQRFDQDETDVDDVAEAGDGFGVSVAAGDVNDDGFADAVVGVALEDIGGVANAGAFHVLFGSDAGLEAEDSEFIHQNASGVQGKVEPKDYFAISLITGDFDGDGHADVAAGALGESVGSLGKAGATSVFYGTDAGLATDNDQNWHQNVTGIGGKAEKGDQVGTFVGAGDFDGDGTSDLIMGAPGEDLTGSKTNAGVANVIYGTDDGLRATGDQTWSQDVTGVPGTAEKNDKLGQVVA